MLSPVLLMAAAGAAVPEYPARAVLDAFATACSGIEVLEVAKASARAAGWEELEPAADSLIGRIVNGGIAAMKAQDQADRDGPQSRVLEGGTYRKSVAGRELFVVISGVAFDEISANGCRVYDLAATAPLKPEELERWAVRKPQTVPTGLPGAEKYVWNPGLKSGHMEMDVSFLPQGTRLPPPVSEIPLSGLVLTASVMKTSRP